MEMNRGNIDPLLTYTSTCSETTLTPQYIHMDLDSRNNAPLQKKTNINIDIDRGNTDPQHMYMNRGKIIPPLHMAMNRGNIDPH